MPARVITLLVHALVSWVDQHGRHAELGSMLVQGCSTAAEMLCLCMMAVEATTAAVACCCCLLLLAVAADGMGVTAAVLRTVTLAMTAASGSDRWHAVSLTLHIFDLGAVAAAWLDVQQGLACAAGV
jgi:hypothetical protein